MKQRTLNDTYIFRSISDGDRIQKIILEAMEKGKILTPQNMLLPLATIKKSFKYPLKDVTLKAVEQGNIVVLYSPDTVRIPTFLPFIVNKTPDGKLRAIVFADVYGKLDKEDNLSIDAKKLYTVMEAAYIALLFNRNPRQFSSKTGLVSAGSEMYANLFARTFNRKHALNLDKNKLHRVMFLAGKFFLMNHMQMNDSEAVNNYAINNCVGGNKFILGELAEISKDYPNDFDNLETLINSFKREEYNIELDGDVTVRSYIEMFANMYQHSTLLALESYPHFILMVNSAIHGSYMNNQYALEDIVDKVGMKQYNNIATFR